MANGGFLTPFDLEQSAGKPLNFLCRCSDNIHLLSRRAADSDPS